MKINDLKSIISSVDNPVAVFNEDGKVVCKNSKLNLVCEYLGLKKIESKEDLELVFGKQLCPYKKEFKVGKSHLKGDQFERIFDDGSKYTILVFKNTMGLDEEILNIMAHIDEIIVLFDEKGVLKRMNGICDELLPFRVKDVLGKNIKDVVKEGKVENPIISEMLEKKKKVFRDIRYPDGRVISYTAVPLLDECGSLKGGVLTGRDVSRLMNLAKTTTKSFDLEVKEYVSNSEEIKRIKSIINRIKNSDTPVFIIGESGTGKEIMANNVWSKSLRKDKPFVAINCASIPTELVESELFGYEKGSFTGAKKDGKIGLIEAADGGTLFLDEIGELSLEVQKKLLRVIQEEQILKVGSIKPKKVDIRYICATNKTVEELKDPKIFRQDLYYRLNVIPLVIPPLRERREDILLISNFYIDLFNEKYNRQVYLTDCAEKILLKNPWKGNIRELKNVIERLVILCPLDKVTGDQIERIIKLGNINELEDDAVIDLGADSSEDKVIKKEETDQLIIHGIMDVNEAHRMVEEELVKNAVEKYGNITNAAKAIGVNPSTIYRKIKSGYINL